MAPIGKGLVAVWDGAGQRAGGGHSTCKGPEAGSQRQVSGTAGRQVRLEPRKGVGGGGQGGRAFFQA